LKNDEFNKDRVYMSDLTPEEEKLKRHIFESMSPRRQRQIEKKGYDKWDPFLKPKEPPFIKGFEAKTGMPENPLELYHYYLTHGFKDRKPDHLSEQYLQGVMEACQAIRTQEERFRAYSEFYLWYRAEKAKTKEKR
jgi:hypothetical protein